MCYVSNMSTGYWEQKPFVPLQTWPAQEVFVLAEVIKKLDAIDKKLGLRDCKDPEKEKFLNELDRRVKSLEADMRERKILRDDSVKP